jgi:cyclophilin family peptidyl-prolyl cis-trans isomerase
MRALTRGALACLFFGASSLLAAGQEPAAGGAAAPAAAEAPAPAAAPAAEAPAADAAAAKAEFDRAVADLKQVAADLAALQTRWATGTEADRRDIQAQWDPLVAKGDQCEQRLTAAAEKLYTATAGKDKQATDVLVDVLLGPDGLASHDAYEEGLRLGEVLIANQCPDKRVYDMAGVAALMVNQFDKAKTYLATAEKEGVLSPMGRSYNEQLPDLKAAWEKEQKIREAEAKADDLPRVLLKTNKGDIELELFENEAPNTAANFVSLVEKGFYDGLTFHRVLPHFMAQGGCPRGDGRGGPGYTIPDECRQPNFRRHFRGSLSMAKSAAPDSGGSQFFITFVPTTGLDGQHTVFGRVIKGIEVLPKLQLRDPEKPNPPQPDRIVEAKVLRKRNHEYVPKTLPE